MAETQTPPTTVGDRVRGARTMRRRTQTEVAILLGLSPSAYARRELNDPEFKASEVSAIARLLGVPAASLLDEEVGP